MIPRPLLTAALALAIFGPFSAACRAQGAKPTEDQQEVLAAIKDETTVEGAIAKLEKLAKDRPKSMAALFFLASARQQEAGEFMQKGDRKGSIPAFLKSAEAARKLRALKKDLNPDEAMLVSYSLYNGARSLAIEKRADEAMKMLAESVDAGFPDAKAFASDDEIAPLRKLKGFDELGIKVKANQAVAEAREKKEQAERKAEMSKAEAEETKKFLAELPALLKENKPFPFAFNLPGLDDKKVSNDDFKGKVVIVDFWGTWCPPCRAEIPHFAELSKQYKDKGLAIVGLTYEQSDPDDAKKSLREFLKENDVPYPCLLGDEATEKQVPDMQGYPTTLFLDRSGKVRLKVEGAKSKAALEAIVKALLDEKAE